MQMTGTGRASVILRGTLNNELTFKEFLRRTAFRNDQFGPVSSRSIDLPRENKGCTASARATLMRWALLASGQISMCKVDS